MKLRIIGLVGLTLATCGLLFAQNPRPISTIIVPHHDLVASERSEMFADIAKRQQPKQIILLSPNHYDIGTATYQTRQEDFTTRYGTIKTDRTLHDIASANGSVDTQATYTSEHGIITILPDIKHYFPNASILTLVIKKQADHDTTTNLLKKLRENCSDCLLIASIDFSHYQPYQLSELHDTLSIDALKSLDSNAIRSDAEIGEPHIAAAAMEWAKMNGTKHFIEYNHTNSTELTKDYFAEGTTHVFGWYETGPIAQTDAAVSFTFAGDIMFDRAIRQRFQNDYTKILAKLGDRVLWGTDVVAANLEGPITRIPSLPKPNDAPNFDFSPSSIQALRMLHINHLLVDNNHTSDSGKAGYTETLDHLRAAGITAVSSDIDPSVIKGNNQSIVLFGLDVSAGDRLNPLEIKRYSKQKSTNVVVFVHWGPEYETNPSAYQRQLAHEWIDAGADLIIGTGPHVIQPAEVYAGRPVFYSLGNFIFDFDSHTSLSQNIIITGRFTDSSIELVPLLLDSDRYQPVLQRSAKADRFLLDHYVSDLAPFVSQQQGGMLICLPKK